MPQISTCRTIRDTERVGPHRTRTRLHPPSPLPPPPHHTNQHPATSNGRVTWTPPARRILPHKSCTKTCAGFIPSARACIPHTHACSPLLHPAPRSPRHGPEKHPLFDAAHPRTSTIVVDVSRRPIAKVPPPLSSPGALLPALSTTAALFQSSRTSQGCSSDNAPPLSALVEGSRLNLPSAGSV